MAISDSCRTPTSLLVYRLPHCGQWSICKDWCIKDLSIHPIIPCSARGGEGKGEGKVKAYMEGLEKI